MRSKVSLTSSVPLDRKRPLELRGKIQVRCGCAKIRGAARKVAVCGSIEMRPFREKERYGTGRRGICCGGREGLAAVLVSEPD